MVNQAVFNPNNAPSHSRCDAQPRRHDVFEPARRSSLHVAVALESVNTSRNTRRDQPRFYRVGINTVATCTTTVT